MRVPVGVIGILVLLALTADSALAANQAVTASSNVFTPTAVTVIRGESVTWTNAGGSHNVQFDDNSFTQPAVPESGLWTVSRTFDSPGTFRYYCYLHGGPGGVGMSGTVTVQAPGGTPGPGPGPEPGPGPPQPVSADKAAPVLKLGGRKRQRVRRAVVVAVEVGEASTVVAKGTVAVPGAGKVFRLRKASKQLAAGAKAQLALKLPKRASRAFRRALERRTRLTAKLTVTAKDAAGNTRSAKRKIALKA